MPPKPVPDELGSGPEFYNVDFTLQTQLRMATGAPPPPLRKYSIKLPPSPPHPPPSSQLKKDIMMPIVQAHSSILICPPLRFPSPPHQYLPQLGRVKWHHAI